MLNEHWTTFERKIQFSVPHFSSPTAMNRPNRFLLYLRHIFNRILCKEWMIIAFVPKRHESENWSRQVFSMFINLQIVFYSFICRARPPKYISKLIIAFIWIISILFSIPMALALRVVQIPFRKYLHSFNEKVEIDSNQKTNSTHLGAHRKWRYDGNVSILWHCQFCR